MCYTASKLYVPRSVVLEPLVLPWLEDAGVSVAVLRLDKTDVLVSGNKWFKLHYYLDAALKQQSIGLISVGGVYSNHLHAMAVAGYKHKLKTVGLIRGEPKQTPTITDLQSLGMSIHWLSYGEFRRRYSDDFWKEWSEQYPSYYAVPEGGSGVLGAKGCAIIPQLIKEQLPLTGWQDYDAIYLSVGTGSTLVGLVWGEYEQGRHPVVGVLATPVSYRVNEQIITLCQSIKLHNPCYQLIEGARKGFGQLDEELVDFMDEIKQTTGLPLDPVYTAKTLYCLKQQVLAGVLARGAKLIFIHTGGLQGFREGRENSSL